MVTDGAVAPMQSLAMGSARAADVAGNSEHMDCKRVGPGGGLSTIGERRLLYSLIRDVTGSPGARSTAAI